MTRRWLIPLAGCLAVVPASVGILAAGRSQQPVAGPPPSSLSSPSSAKAILDQYCIGCHNERVKTAGLALDAIDPGQVDQHPETWEKAVRKLRVRMMPPLGRPRPDEAGYNAMVSYLETSLDRAAAARPNPGRIDTFRRLNRTEYQNAIRDLLALDVDVSALLPKDDASHGFDNVGVGEFSPTLLERYLAAAQKVSRLAVGSPVPSPASNVVTLPADLTQEDHVEGLPFGTRGGTTIHHTFPLDGAYEIQVRLSRDRNENVEGLIEPHQVELALDGNRIQLFTVKPNRNQSGTYYADEAVDKDLKVRVPVPAGPHDIVVTFPRKTFALPETERQPHIAHFNMDRHPRLQPAVHSVSITGPFDTGRVADTPSRRRIFTCRPSTSSGRPAPVEGRSASTAEEAGCAKTIVSTLARRAYRRAVTDQDVQVPMEFYNQARADGGFDAGIEMALRAILASTEFLFRIERDPAAVAPNTAYRISDVELASRLSFFLWSSVPDKALLDLAIAGKLSDPKILDTQVRRMLADSRAESLVTDFAGQWLYLRNLAAVSPDARMFPDFDDNLRQAFRQETELFFDSIVKEDRSVLDLLRANYTFVNERLARHYGIPNVYGSRFRRVALSDDTVRGGLLGQGSILTVTSYANRTSPVLRGKWILENILGTPPPPPPPNVPPLSDNRASGHLLSMRERMAQHRMNAACSGCHQLMDPAGLSMEHFDAIGRWRARTEAGTAVDATGSLPDGSTFDGMAGLRAALLNRPELFVSTVTEKLLTYALGRGLEYYDAPAVRAITRAARENDYRFSSLVLGVIESRPFRMRMKTQDVTKDAN
jgi:mono/diheme cytochrome c family protein